MLPVSNIKTIHLSWPSLKYMSPIHILSTLDAMFGNIFMTLNIARRLKYLINDLG